MSKSDVAPPARDAQSTAMSPESTRHMCAWVNKTQVYVHKYVSLFTSLPLDLLAHGKFANWLVLFLFQQIYEVPPTHDASAVLRQCFLCHKNAKFGM